MVLCCIEGLSYDLAAHRLGVTEPTLRGRLASRSQAARITVTRSWNHGERVASASASAVEPIRLTLPPLPASLVETTVQFSIRWPSVAGLLSGAAVIPDSIAGLAQGVIKTMLLQSLKLSGIGLLLVSGALGTLVVAQQGKNDNGGAQAVANPSGTTVQATPDTPSEAKLAEVRKNVDQLANQIGGQLLAEKTSQVEKQLDLVIDAKLPAGTTLEQFLKHIKQQTTEAIPPGIPIYVSPLGLQEANKSMESATEDFAKNGPVRAILEQTLLGTGLSFAVDDGFLMIDSRTRILERRVGQIDHKLNRVLEALDRLEKAK